MPNDPCRKSPDGFTLIELLVAICILAVVAVLGWQGLDSILRSRNTLATELVQVREMQLTFAQLQRDCEQLAGKLLVGARPIMAISEQKLVLVRQLSRDDQPLQLQVVVYQLVDGKLIRQESSGMRDLRELDRSWRTAAGDGVFDAQPVTLHAAIRQMGVRYWPENANGWRTISGNAALTFTATDPAIPSGLEITLHPTGQGMTVKTMLLGAR